MPKPRLGAHTDQDPHAKQGDLLLDIYHKYQRAIPPDGQEGLVWDPGYVHGHGSTRAERVRTGIFWGESESGRSHWLTLHPDDGNDVGDTDQAETLRGRVVSDCGGLITSMLSQAGEDVDARSNWAGCQALRSEVRDGCISDGVFLVVKGEDDLCDVLEPLDRGVGGQEGVTGEEYKFHEWTELDCLVMAGALGALA